MDWSVHPLRGFNPKDFKYDDNTIQTLASPTTKVPTK